MSADETEDLLRTLASRVLGALVRRYGHFDTAQDAVQEAMLAAATRWPREGTPDNPRGWLITVASRKLTDLLRKEQAQRDREEAAARLVPQDRRAAPSADRHEAGQDDTLILLNMCCHPSLSPTSQIALTLRAVGGLTTGEIARAFLVPGDTMTRRISRAKRSINDSGVPFALPPEAERVERLDAVLQVLYLIFNEGYVSTSGPSLQRTELASEAIRLTRMLHESLPEDNEVTGLLALMLLTHARRDARTDEHGTLLAMADQNRSLWDAGQISEGVGLVSEALPHGTTGPYQLQAAIAAIHDEAPDFESTDWPQILALYEVLMQVSDNPVVALNRAVAVAMVQGSHAGLALLDDLESDNRINADHRVLAVRGHLLAMDGDNRGAQTAFQQAADRATHPAQQRYLRTRATRLSG